MSSGEISIAGGWLGTYAYKGVHQAVPPVRFEARFDMNATESGKVTGMILDDGSFGEATITGMISGRIVKFTKSYRADPTRIGRSEYEGLLSEDGKQITGTWQMSKLAHGVWEARRSWQEEQEPEAVSESLRQSFNREDALIETVNR